jgi:hypothetical protein
MTIDNVKDQPHLPRTDDINVILHNFVEYYSKLYEHKRICPVALDRLIKNLTLMLDMEETEELDKPIMDKDMLAALITTPKGKSPGTDPSHIVLHGSAHGGSCSTYRYWQPSTSAKNPTGLMFANHYIGAP